MAKAILRRGRAVNLRLRFSETLRRRIEQAARRNDQSMNAEIISRLERSFTNQDLRRDLANLRRDLTALIATNGPQGEP